VRITAAVVEERGGPFALAELELEGLRDAREAESGETIKPGVRMG